MIVDATALPEQVADDVIASAFRSAGQRCSALRLLCVQDDVADKVLAMVERRGARTGGRRPARDRDPGRSGDRRRGARQSSMRWIADRRAAVRFRWDDERALPARGSYVAPTIIALERARDLREEVFGPVLHVVRWPASGLDRLLDDIAGNGTALTLGIHSRIEATAARIAARLPHGNVYVNRNMIGAVVGSAAFRRQRAFRHRAESGRPALSCALRVGAGGHGQHRRRRRQRHAAERRGLRRPVPGRDFFDLPADNRVIVGA